MSDLDTYDAQVQAIEAYNAPILHGFLIWLKQSGLSVETIYNHVTNIEFSRNISFITNRCKNLMRPRVAMSGCS